MDTFLTMLRYDIRRMWDRRWVAAGIAWAVAVVFAVGVFFLRDRYEASARIYVDTQSVLKPLMAGLAFQPDIDQQVRMLAKTLISRPNVELLYKDPRIGLDYPPPAKHDQVMEAMKDKIKVTSMGTGNLFSISYRDSDQQRAQRLVEALVKIFEESSSDNKTRGSTEASRFIEEQIKEYDTKLVEAENRLKDFKLRNFGVTGVTGGANQDYFGRMAALSDEVAKLKLSLVSAEQSRDALKRELKSEDPQLPPESMPSMVAQPSELEVRLQAQRRTLDELLRRYTDDHPDVISARRVIAQIERQQKDEAEGRKNGVFAGRGSAATNPVYQRLRINLAEAEAKLAAMRSELGVQQGRLDQVRALAGRQPQVEAEFTQLNRDYDIVRKNYDQLVARREAASLGVKIDQSSQLADFRIVEPPQVAPSPVFPGRKVLAALAMVVALALSGVAVFAMGRMRPTIDSLVLMHELSGRPVLGSVSLLRSPEQRKQRQRDIYIFASLMLVFVAMHAVWVVLIARQVV
jgi:polysaccharide chain length determinant protein (PEP-CTERM system associated)